MQYKRGDFHSSITEPSPGEPAISMLTSAMEIQQLLFDVSEWWQRKERGGEQRRGKERREEGTLGDFVKVEALKN